MGYHFINFRIFGFNNLANYECHGINMFVKYIKFRNNIVKESDKESLHYIKMVSVTNISTFSYLTLDGHNNCIPSLNNLPSL